jgi:hypothetical protein
MKPRSWTWPLLLALCGGAGCGSEASARSPLLPASYPDAFVDVQACAQSVDHDLAYVLVKASPEAADIYRNGPFPFPAGSVISKELFTDAGCTTLTGFAVMRKEAAGHDPSGGDWRWEKLDDQRRPVAGGHPRGCASCHAGAGCRDRDFTCAER